MLAKLKKIDIPIVVILFVFMIISTMLVYSASMDHPTISIGIQKMIVLYVIGFLAFLGVSLFDYRLLLKISVYLYGAGVLSLLAVYVFGAKINGARGWFALPGGLNFQPAELVKLILVIVLTRLLSRKAGGTLEFRRDLLPIGAAVFLPFLLVLIQPDLGNAIIFIVILVGMLWIANIKYMHVLIATVVIVGGSFLALLLYQHFHDPLYAVLKNYGVSHWADRMDTYLFPQNVSRDEKFQVYNAVRAIGSGGFYGDGYMKGNSVHANLVPLAYSDSIFVVVGEEFGFRGAALLLLIYFLLIYRMILISIQSTFLSGSYVVVGIVSMMVFQIFENVGMMLDIMPLTGITLPFVSYGGTSLLINMMSIGLIMSVKLHQDIEPELI
ncbi:FtsW/RodA/SpoVE family cell cycle protein [Paenibacillus athensensis]|uniref:Cell cycle protein n=1 Tax=Paenibacillus athensensis TaxID=1967502 RepID=A0A4Y8PUW4_9BACL|nr:FtsW/RodA/SpoVE family cell cycle protein [Paenibacillus athensensis]MCD1258212.1 FtsW/RodA/SpoVE family cell cycle protein [Paenibacillus athensensis]